MNGLPEDWLNMPFEQVFRHVAGDNLLVCIQSLEKSFAHFRGHFESDVQQLPNIRIVALAGLNVAERLSVSLRVPRCDRLGIADQLKSKTILVPGAHAAEVVAKGEAEIGAAQTSEIVPVAGAEVLGPLPGEFASTTLWTAAIGATTKVPEAAKSLIQFLTGPVARPVFTAKGFQPG